MRVWVTPLFGLVLFLSVSTHIAARVKSRSWVPSAAPPSFSVNNRAAAVIREGEEAFKSAEGWLWGLGNATQELWWWLGTHLLLSHGQQLQDPHQGGGGGEGSFEDALVKICIPISITTRGTKWTRLNQMLLLTSLLPSLVNTTQPGYRFGLYLGYDRGDPLLDSPEAQLELHKLGRDIIGSSGIVLKSFCYDDSRNRNVWAVNYITRECYLDGYDYFYRVNDDSAMEGKWASILVDRLRSTNNFGVVGTLDKGNPRIFTHSMVGRPHIEVFGYYFPFEFGNYWSDDWITEVYEPPFVHRSYDVSVKHHIHAERYTVEYERKNLLALMVNLCRKRWKAFLCLRQQRHDYCTADSVEFENVWPELEG